VKHLVKPSQVYPAKLAPLDSSEAISPEKIENTYLEKKEDFPQDAVLQANIESSKQLNLNLNEKTKMQIEKTKDNQEKLKVNFDEIKNLIASGNEEAALQRMSDLLEQMNKENNKALEDSLNKRIIKNILNRVEMEETSLSDAILQNGISGCTKTFAKN
jgi:hypothetical protein